MNVTVAEAAVASWGDARLGMCELWLAERSALTSCYLVSLTVVSRPVAYQNWVAEAVVRNRRTP